jgi:hypothetical protein
MRLLRILAVVLALAALAALVLSGPGTRFDAWSYRVGLALFRGAAYLGLASALAAVLVLALPRARRAGVAMPVLALLLGLAVFYVPYQVQRGARSLPPINDISTDTQSPPQFMTALHPYPGAAFARQQQSAYPDLAGVILPLAPREAFARALAAAEAMGWEVVGRDADAGRLEAVDTTRWFGFKDDIAVRVRAAGAGSLVDVRSRSRVGRGDLGTNARRVRAYLERLQAFGGTLRGVERPEKGKPMKKTALILALAIVLPAWAQDKPAEKPAAQEAGKAEPAKAEQKAEAPKKAARKHSSRRMEDARHCLDKPTNTEIIKCAEAYL